MGLALALPLGLDVLVRNVREATGDFTGAVSCRSISKPASPKRARRQLASTARERPGVERVELITATQALAQFRAQSGFGAALDALEDNPLPHVLVVTPRPARANPASMETLRDTSPRGPRSTRCSSTATGCRASTPCWRCCTRRC